MKEPDPQYNTGIAKFVSDASSVRWLFAHQPGAFAIVKEPASSSIRYTGQLARCDFVISVIPDDKKLPPESGGYTATLVEHACDKGSSMNVLFAAPSSLTHINMLRLHSVAGREAWVEIDGKKYSKKHCDYVVTAGARPPGDIVIHGDVTWGN